MTDPTSRALRLLDLLQTHRRWSGPDLARRLGISLRTLRRDVERLRELGYVVDSAPGEVGGYQLSAGSAVPPLLLDDDEAVALAVGIRTATLAGRGVDASARTMAKLDALLPTHLRRRAAALSESVVDLGAGPRPDAESLGELALACRDHERARFGYTDKVGTESRRHVDPYRLVARAGRWYLLCHDVDRQDWRTFRVDRLSDVRRTGARFVAEQLDEAQVAAFFRPERRTAHHAEVTIEASPADVRAAFGRWASGVVGIEREGRADAATLWPLRGATPQEVLGAVLWIPTSWDWSIACDREVAGALAAVRDRLLQVQVSDSDPQERAPDAELS